jgi:hypothetical protein
MKYDFKVQNWIMGSHRIENICNWLTGVFLALVLGLFAGACGSQRAYAEQIQQHSWVADIPIMAELSVEPALGFAFDSPSGRIVMIFASSTEKSTKIMSFYNESLSAMGWIGGNGEWRKDMETFVISEVDTIVGTLWRLMVRPH